MTHEDRKALGLFALDFFDNLEESEEDGVEILNTIIMVARRGEDGEVGYAYRSQTSDEGENVSLLLDVLKAELQQA